MEPANQGSGAPAPSPTRQNRTLQAVLLFFLLLLVVLILALVTGSLGNKTTVSNSNNLTATAGAAVSNNPNSKILSGGDNSATLTGTTTAQSQSQQAAAAMTPGGVSTGQTAGSSTSGSLPGGSASLPGSNNKATTLASPRLGNYVCATGSTGNLTYQSDFTLLDGQKYKHSSNPNQEYSFTYNSATQAITWLDGPNSGTVGIYYLPDVSHSYRIIEQNKSSATALTCSLAEK